MTATIKRRNKKPFVKDMSHPPTHKPFLLKQSHGTNVIIIHKRLIKPFKSRTATIAEANLWNEPMSKWHAFSTALL
jgi:copper oxidase (laccase) domain-containing protein